MVDGVMVCSCLVLAVETAGAKIDTIEGMARAPNCIRCSRSSSSIEWLAMRHLYARHPDCRAALLERNPDPTETEIRYWLAGNLCRCTGYDKIIRSVQAAAKEMRGE